MSHKSKHQSGSSVSKSRASQHSKQQPNLSRDVQGQLYDVVADNLATLSWSNAEAEDVVIRGSSDFALLRGFKNALLALRQDFIGNEKGKIIIDGDKKQDFNRRLLLLEHEIEGLLKRRINFSLKDQEGGHRNMDYTGILNEKENQIVELEKKIQNYEERMRRIVGRESQLENHIANLDAEIRRKDEIIKNKNDIILAEFAHGQQFKDAWTKVRKNIESARGKTGADFEKTLFEGVIIPTTDQIRSQSLTKDNAASRSAVGGLQRIRGQLVTLFKELEKVLSSQDANQAAIDRVLEGAILGMEGSKLRESLQQGMERVRLEDKYNNLKLSFGSAAGLFKLQLDRLKLQNPGAHFEFDSEIFNILQSEKIETSIVGGVMQVERFTEKTIEVPVQDARTKHLIHLLSIQMKKFVERYPKLRDEMDSRLFEFFQQEIIDVMEVDEVDKLVSIVKYVPQVVKVENVYAYSSQKSKRVEFHLRVLIKALLEELEKLKRRTGMVLEMDEGIVAMINQEIMGVIDVDDVLKIFRVVPKIVEVEKIVEKVVERLVEIPQVIPIEKIVEKIVEVIKIQEVERLVHVPVEIIRYVDNVIEKIVEVEKIIEKIVEVPRIIEKIIERVVEIPKITEVINIVERIVEVEVPITVERVVNHLVPEVKEIQVIKEKIVPVETIIERIVEVPTIVEKIVEKIVQVPQIIEVEKLVEKIVKVVEYINAREVVNHVETIYEVVDRIIEKPIPVVQIVERIVEVPQVIEKVVAVQNEVVRIQEIKVIEEKIVYVDRIKEIEVVVNQIVPLIKQVEKIVDRRVEVPIFVEKIVKVPEIITQIIIERIEVVKIIEVEKIVEKIVEVTKLVEVEKPVTHYIRENQIVKVIVEKIVEVPRTVERLKEVRVNIDKIIEKMVEVPKVVEVEKIVEKIVVVPRVIEKIVEVPQIVEKLVDRIIEIERIREVEKLVQVPVITEKLIQVEVIKNIYHEVEKVVERIVEKIVPFETIIEAVSVVKEPVERIVEVRVEIPKEIEVEKIVTMTIEIEKVIEVQKPTTIAVEVPVPVDRIVEKVVPVHREIEKIVQVPQIMEKIVQVRVEEVRIQEIEKYIDKVVVNERIKEVEKIVPYMQEVIKEVPSVREKIVPVQSIVQEIKTVQNLVEKIVTLTNELPKVYEIEKLVQKVIQVPQIVELEVITPIIIKVNQIIEAIREKTVEIPVIHQEILEVPIIEEKIVAVMSNKTEIKEVIVNRDKIVEIEKLITMTDTRNFIQDQIKTIDRYEDKSIPIFSTVEKIVEVPHILEKIVEKIVIMPQIVEVIKYVHEIIEEETLGVAVNIDISAQETKYKELYGTLKVRFEVLLTELRRLKGKHPELKAAIDVVEKFLIEFDKLAQFQRIVQVNKEKIVEVEHNVPVLVPTRDAISIRTDLANSLLIEKLVIELRRLRNENPNLKLSLDEDVQLIFFSEFGEKSLPNNLTEEMTAQLQSYTESMYRKFTTISGKWSTDHELILSTILQERFTLAGLIKGANLEIEKAKMVADQRLEGLRRYKMATNCFEQKYKSIESELGKVLSNPQFADSTSTLCKMLNDFQGFIGSEIKTMVYEEEPLQILGPIHGMDGDYLRLESVMREKESQIMMLREKLMAFQKERPNPVNLTTDQSRTIQSLKNQINNLNDQLSELRSQSSVNVNISANTQEYEVKIRTLNSRGQELESQLRTVRIDYEGQIITAKTEAEKGLREAQLKHNESERKIASYEREIQSLNKTIADYQRRVNDLTALVNRSESPQTPIQMVTGNIMTSQTPQSLSKPPNIGITPTTGGSSGSLGEMGSPGGLETGNLSSSREYSASGTTGTQQRPTGTGTDLPKSGSGSSSSYSPGNYTSYKKEKK